MSALVRHLAASTHPGPAVAVTAITVLLGVAGGLEWWRVVLLGVAMLAGQGSVGLSNDWLDAERDRAVGRTDKPVARGDVPLGVARGVSFALVVVALAFTVPLGWPALALHAAFIAGAWAYNLALKSTPASPLPYAVCFGMLPALPTLADDPPAWAPLWMLAAGALLGVAAHFANVLPDLDDDRRTGVVGLGHRMGARPTAVAAVLLLAAASVVLTVGMGFTPLAIAGLVVGCGIAAAALVLALRGRIGRVLFRLVIAGALVGVVLLVLGAG